MDLEKGGGKIEDYDYAKTYSDYNFEQSSQFERIRHRCRSPSSRTVAEEMPKSRAAALAAKVTGMKRDAIYQMLNAEDSE